MESFALPIFSITSKETERKQASQRTQEHKAQPCGVISALQLLHVTVSTVTTGSNRSGGQMSLAAF